MNLMKKDVFLPEAAACKVKKVRSENIKFKI